MARHTPGSRSAALFVIAASAAFATSSPLARYARPASPMVVAFGRVALAALLLVAADLRGLRASLRSLGRGAALGVAGAGLLLGAHFIFFLYGLDHTSLPAAVSLVSLEPFAVVLIGWGLHKLPPTRLELGGVCIAVVGAVLVTRAAGTGDHRISGDLLVVGAVVLYGLYVNTARFYRHRLPPDHYVAAVYSVAALGCGGALLAVPGGFANLTALPHHSLFAIVGLALVPTLIGHTMVQTAARTVSPTTVALVSPGETLGSLALGAVWLRTIPTARELAGAIVIVGGVTLALLGSRRDEAEG